MEQGLTGHSHQHGQKHPRGSKATLTLDQGEQCPSASSTQRRSHEAWAVVFKSLTLKDWSKREPCLQSSLTNLSSKTQDWGKRALDFLWLLSSSRTKLGLTTVLKKVKFMMSGIYSTKHIVVLEGSADKQ